MATEQKVINPFALQCCDVSGHRARVSRDIVHVGLGLVVAVGFGSSCNCRSSSPSVVNTLMPRL